MNRSAIVRSFSNHESLLSAARFAAVLAVILVVLGTGSVASADSAVKVSAQDHTCVVTSTGGVKCWGNNRSGQLGDGTFVPRGTPADVIGLGGRATTVAVGGDFTCALMAGGGVKCWGGNAYGQLGDATATGRPTPDDVIGLTSAVAIAAGTEHACAVNAGGGLRCWGRNLYGNLGDGTTWTHSLPVDVVGLGANVVAVGAGAGTTCALTTHGGVKCWGANYRGQLGNGTTQLGATPTPTDVTGLDTGVAVLSVGEYHSCAVTNAGAAKCWGSNYNGQLGDGTYSNRTTPVNVSGLDAGVTAIAAGQTHTCAVIVAGIAKCWGLNSEGELGDGTSFTRTTPVDVTGVAELRFAAISAGLWHSCAVTTGGAVRCWGSNTGGRLGVSVVLRTTPRDVAGLTSGVTAISAYESSTCVVAGGGVKCWGANGAGQLGDGTKITRGTPDYVTGLTSGVAAVAVGGSHACALTTAGIVKCWGNNTSGQLGDGTTTGSTVPVDVVGLRPGVLAIAAGELHTCAVESDGRMMCWGDNFYGQLGDSPGGYEATPVPVTRVPGPLTSIAAGSRGTCGVTDNTAYCWGSGVPPGSFSVPAVAATVGGNQFCVITPAGEAQCWGYGIIGNGTPPPSQPATAPVTVLGLDRGVIGLAAGANPVNSGLQPAIWNYGHSCAVMGGGATKCWGYNYYGKLGDGTLSDRYAPVDVVGLSAGTVAVAAGSNHTCALMSGGGVKCWGDNSSGQLGDGTFLQTLLPVTVKGFGAPQDFNDDGTTDVVWRDAASGEIIVWLMDGTATASEVRLPGTSDTAWKIAAIADFNRDGRPDLFCRNSATGENQVWEMDGLTLVRAVPVKPVPDLNWRVATAAGVNEDGTVNLVWRNAVTGENVIWFMNGSAFLGYVRLPAVPDTRWHIVASADFNADGSSDLLWRNRATGENVVWYIKDAAYGGYVRLDRVDTTWVVGGTGDFNADGKADILWRNPATGENTVSCMDGIAVIASLSLPSVTNPDWHLLHSPDPPRAGPNDFNADGRADIVWRNTMTGENRVWFMNGTTHVSDATIEAVVDPSWRIVGSGDFDGDGEPDLVWRNLTTGENKIWNMNGVTHTGDTPIMAVTDTTWQIVAVADLNADGQPDLLWRNRLNGANVVWFMDGAAVASYTSLPTVPDTAWRIVGAADFSGDGQTDLVWRSSTTGENIIWIMNAGNFSSYVRFTDVTDTRWQIVAAADYDSDGKPDLLWRNSVTGENIIWFMDGTRLGSYARIAGEPDPNWRIGPGL